MSMAEKWTQENLYVSGDEFFSDILSSIASATHSIDAEYYIYANDSLGNEVVKALLQAASRGVKVRLIVDGIGSPNFRKDFGSALQNSALQYQIYHEIPFSKGFSIFSRRGRRKLYYLLASLNKRNHRKVMIIDAQHAYVGSMNVSDCHLKKYKDGKAWRDCAVKVSGSDLLSLISAFEKIWKDKRANTSGRIKQWYRSMRSGKQSNLVRLNSNLLMRRRNYRDLLKRISAARQQVLITTAYFVPRPSLLRAMVRAASRNVDVKLLVPRVSDVFFMPWLGWAYLDRLLKVNISVYEYLPAMMHAKTVVIDDWAIIGSSNLNHRSLLHDLEVDIQLTDKSNIEKLKMQFEIDLKESRKVLAEDWKSRPLWQRAAGKVLHLFRRWF